jgi:hypothetical protein
MAHTIANLMGLIVTPTIVSGETSHLHKIQEK